MSAFGEIKELPGNFKKYQEQLIILMNQHEISSISTLVNNYKNNKSFRNEWKGIWINISKEEGGKLSLTTIGIIIGGSIGGVGIAAMGSAIGLPLALVLGLGGLLSGAKFDSLNVFGSKKSISIELPKELIQKIESDAKTAHVSISELVERLLLQAYKQGV